MDNSLIPQHKRMAMGQSIDQGGDDPGLSRGHGRGKDSTKSGMPSGEQQRPPFFADSGNSGASDNDGDEPGKVNVRGHKRSMPGMRGSY